MKRVERREGFGQKDGGEQARERARERGGRAGGRERGATGREKKGTAKQHGYYLPLKRGTI